MGVLLPALMVGGLLFVVVGAVRRFGARRP
jgi:hypothetical protein